MAQCISRPSFRTAALAALLASGGATAIHAQGLVHEVKVGGLYHDPGDLWSGFRREPRSLDINIEVQLGPHVNVLWGTLRPAIGATINTRGATSKGYLDARWEVGAPEGLFFATGLGGAIHDGTTDLSDANRKALGSRVLFHIPAEAGWRWTGGQSISLYFEHVSNGYTKARNEGLDVWGTRYGYRF